MTKETVLRIAQLSGAVQVLEKLINNLEQQTAALNKQVNDLKEANQ